MHRRTWAMVLVLVGVGGLLTGCGGKPVVGVLLPSTGAAAIYGESIESGLRVALARARERGELPAEFEVVWADTGSDTETAVSEFRRLVSERGVKMVIGGATSGEARALLPVLEDLQIVCLSPSASAPDLTRASKYFYRIFPSDELEGNRSGKFLYDTLKVDAVVVYVGDSEYTRGIEPEFLHQFHENFGGTVIGRVDVAEAGWQEASAELLRTHRPKAVYVIGYADEILAVLGHLQERAYRGRIVTTSAFYSGRSVQKAGAMAEGIFFPLPPFDRFAENDCVQGFVTRYMDTYERAPDIFAAHGYDAMNLVLKVMSIATPPLTPEIKKALQFGIGEFMGCTGPIVFDDYGDVKHYPKMFIVADGKVITYQRHLKAERDRLLREVQELLGSRR